MYTKNGHKSSNRKQSHLRETISSVGTSRYMPPRPLYSVKNVEVTMIDEAGAAPKVSSTQAVVDTELAGGL